MEDATVILRKLGELEQVEAELASISSRTDEGRKRDLIALRRQLAERIAEIGRLAEPFFLYPGRTELLQEYRSKFLRSAAARYQANWPAVMLDQADDEYRRSVTVVRSCNRDFIIWMRRAIA